MNWKSGELPLTYLMETKKKKKGQTLQQQKNKKNKEKAKHQRHQTDINHMQCTSHLIGNRISRAPELTCAQKQTSPRFSSSLWERHRLGCGPGRRNLTEGGGEERGENA